MGLLMTKAELWELIDELVAAVKELLDGADPAWRDWTHTDLRFGAGTPVGQGILALRRVEEAAGP